MNHYDWLISRLDAFIRKYYTNQLLRGSLLLLICVLFYILAASVGEYFLYMPVWLKLIIVGGFVVLGLFALIWLVIIPLLKMGRLGKTISHEQAATIIGDHFPEISDKLLNILQLKKQTDQYASKEFIEASIDQKASQLSLVPIGNAVDFSKNKRFLPYLLPLVLIGVFLLVAAPNVFKEASTRLLSPTKTFEKPAPFQFIIDNTDLRAVRNEDYTLKVSVAGDALPLQMAVEVDGDLIAMQPGSEHQFSYTFRNVTEDIEFRLSAGGFYSIPYTLTAAQKPLLTAFTTALDYPAYTGKKDETRSSLSDMTIPEGTRVKWLFTTDHTDAIYFIFNTNAAKKLGNSRGKYQFEALLTQDTLYTLALQNNTSSLGDSFHYRVQVIKDQYPVISLQERRDTITGKQILLTGTAADDYGISKVFFHYEIVNEQNQRLARKVVPLKTTSGALTNFQHYFDVSAFNLQIGQKLNYYIEAWDNDGVNGSKATRSDMMSYYNYTAKQLDSAIVANSKQINSGLSNGAQQSKQMQNEFKEMQSKMLQSENNDWQQQQNMQELLDKQMKLQNQMEDVKKRFEEQKQQSQQKEYSEDVKEKQEALEKQLDNLLNKELKEQMKKLQELMQKLNKEQTFKAMQEMEQENKLFNMDMERMQEMMKQLEMEMRLEDMANKMNDLAEKQLDLKDKTDKEQKDAKELAKEQEALKKELDEVLKKDMKEAKELSKELKKQADLDGDKQKGEDAAQEMQQSQQSLEQNQNSKSSKSQSKAAQNLKQMAAMMQQQAGGMSMEQLDMDIKAVRQLLTNLMRLSFDEEKLMQDVQQTNTASKKYLEQMQQQQRLHSNSILIKDSLFSLSKHVFSLAATVNKETTEIEGNMKSTTNALENRRIGEAVTRQQYIMTHANNLALMLNEVLNNLMQQKSMAMNQPANGNCTKPGGAKPKPGMGKQLSDIITKQRKMGEGMQQMQDGKKPGDKEGQQKGEGQGQGEGQNGKKQGKAGSSGEYGDAEKLAKMAQQQAAIRRQLQELQSLLNSNGMGAAKELQEIQEKMDKIETNLVNRRYDPEMLTRHKEIMTRLLETEKAIREQEQDNKRSSKNPEELARPVPPELQQYLQNQQKMFELYKTVPPQLKPYYRKMVEQYFKEMGK